MSIPKVFISYSHDNLAHKKWVLDLGARLRNNGIDAILDQWDLTPGDDLPHFMEQNLAVADYILMICTERYVQKANQGIGGVGYEKMIITASLMNKIDENKIIPLIRQTGTYEVPTFLKTKLFIDFSKTDDYEFSFDNLIRKIHRSPIFKKPVLGNNPFLEKSEKKDNKRNDALGKLMKIVIRDYESGSSYTKYIDLKQELDISRIMLDMLISQAVTKKYVKKDNDSDLWLLEDGKFYAIQNGLIK